MKRAKFNSYIQLDAMDCGPASLKMIAEYYGKHFSLESLRNIMHVTREGVSLFSISEAAESIGFKSVGGRFTINQINNEIPLPCILHWKQEHFVVLYKVKPKSILRNKPKFYIADPANGHMTYSENEFVNNWISTKTSGEDKGIALLLEATQDFYRQKGEKHKTKELGFLLSHFKRFRKFISQLLLALLLGSLFQFIFPFLTQAIVDKGIADKDISLVYVILMAQMMLVLSRMSVEFIRRWILLHISTRINISLVSDFFIKLMKLPMSYFDTKLIGDLLQRMDDHGRVERFITTRTLDTIFSFFTLIIFGVVLFVYSFKIFIIFLIGSILYVLWIFLFLKKRRQLDYKYFEIQAEEQGKVYQLIHGMQEIKLQNAEKRKRWEWEDIQAKLFNVNTKSLKLDQQQEAGKIFINEGKNILITIIAALSVINNEMSLGMMLATQYIIGQLTLPIDQFARLIHDFQDTKISLERINEIHQQEDEDVSCKNLSPIIQNKAIVVNNLTFQYEGLESPKVLNQLSITIPQSKVTAIIGASGSGKTTLIKLLLKYYKPISGAINIDGQPLEQFNTTWWRNQCGVVMQDGFIFSESIAHNIAASSNEIDKSKLVKAAKIANIHETIMEMPLMYNTVIGIDGQNLSQGQRQRILIARAIYKNPDFLFLDEATNALDANNEKTIVENLQEFYKGKTVIIVAHRLSTVKNADQIIVLDNGSIVEAGNHKELSTKKGSYYNLVKNQLELGN
jgi:ATP-binding cassette, subfamily B, bacterial